MTTLITHSRSGAKAEVYSFGATVTSFVSASGRELLFVSKDAKLDGSKAIRGGIPLVFPQFGQPDTSMPQHGFLRNNVWTVNESSKYDSDQAAGVSLDLKLSEVVNARGGKWAEGTDLDCELVLNIKVQPNALTTTLTIKNTGTKSFDFQTLFHTYYLVADHQALNKEHCNVKGLEGYSCDDKITGESYIQGSDPIVIDGEVDRVYNPPADKPAVEIVIQTGSGTFAQLKASGFVDGKEVLASCVVWNPHQAKAESMGDFNNDGYHDMICCEPGLLSNVPELEGGKECTFTQTITI